MEPYRNLSGNSGVAAFEIGRDSIRVLFVGGEVYRYTYESAGEDSVEEMKKLARAGKGLSSFIAQVVRLGYAEKE